jgi:hypothetical protein
MPDPQRRRHPEATGSYQPGEGSRADHLRPDHTIEMLPTNGGALPKPRVFTSGARDLARTICTLTTRSLARLSAGLQVDASDARSR